MKARDQNGAEPAFDDVFKSLHHVEKTTDEPLIRVMALHALAYCERLFYLEEVEEIRVADANVYAGRREHEELNRGADRYTVELASERLGIRGKVDCVRRTSGSLVVYEHKKGKSRDGKDAWPSDRLQVLAYTLLLAEHTGEKIEEARVKYHADNCLISIAVNAEEAGEEVRAMVERARELRASVERPPICAPERMCRNCSLAPVCLPEEERFAACERGKPRRLFPPDDERVIHIVEQGSSIRKDGEQLVVYMPDGTKKPLPSASIGSLVLHGNVQASTQVIHFCAAREIGIHWLSFGGRYVGALSPGAGGVQRKNRQYKALGEPFFRTRMALRLTMAKVENQLRYILRCTRSRQDADRPVEVENRISRIKQELAALAHLSGKIDAQEEDCGGSSAPDSNVGNPEDLVETIRGHEGLAGREYFALFPHVLRLKEGDLLHFGGRSRRPPKDPFNALLSFGYALLYKDCMAALLAVGLEPSLGFMHTPRSAAYPLALDLMELFRVILWDVPLIGSVNRKQWGRADFDVTAGQVWLNVEGRRKAIQLYESRKQEKWKHPVLEYSLSYARTMELEARMLEKEWSGSPGLFARIRLR
jgi:CRISPR-associated protein Cas1